MYPGMLSETVPSQTKKRELALDGMAGAVWVYLGSWIALGVNPVETKWILTDRK